MGGAGWEGEGLLGQLFQPPESDRGPWAQGGGRGLADSLREHKAITNLWRHNASFRSHDVVYCRIHLGVEWRAWFPEVLGAFFTLVHFPRGRGGEALVTSGWRGGRVDLGYFYPSFKADLPWYRYLASFPNPTGLSWDSLFASFNLILGSYSLVLP